MRQGSSCSATTCVQAAGRPASCRRPIRTRPRGAAAAGGTRAPRRPSSLRCSHPTRASKRTTGTRSRCSLDANIIRPFLNNGGERAGGVADDEFGRFGPIALYVGGAGEVRFADLAYKDLAIQTRVKEELSNRFRLQKLTDFYYAWGAGAADFDHDGVTDVVAGPHIFYGPDYVRRREIYVQIATNPSERVHARLLDAVRRRLHRRRLAGCDHRDFYGHARRVVVREPQGGIAPVGQARRGRGIQHRDRRAARRRRRRQGRARLRRPGADEICEAGSGEPDRPMDGHGTSRNRG